MSHPTVFATPYNRDHAAASDAAVCYAGEVSMTLQSHAEDADINVIVKRFGLTGVMPIGHRVPEYGDFSGIGDYRSALAAVEAAHDHFMEMPHEVRSRFANDPQQFLDFCSNANNLPEMRKLGLAVPEVPKETTLGDVVAAVKDLAPKAPGGTSG